MVDAVVVFILILEVVGCCIVVDDEGLNISEYLRNLLYITYYSIYFTVVPLAAPTLFLVVNVFVMVAELVLKTISE